MTLAVDAVPHPLWHLFFAEWRGDARSPRSWALRSCQWGVSEGTDTEQIRRAGRRCGHLNCFRQWVCCYEIRIAFPGILTLVAFNSTSEAAQTYEPLSWLRNQVGFSYSRKVCQRVRVEGEGGGDGTLRERPRSGPVLGFVSLQPRSARGAREPVWHIAVWPTWTL